MKPLDVLGKLLQVSRPVSWVNTAYPFAAGYLVLGGNNMSLLVIGALYFLVPYNLLMYGVNDVFDYESDIRNPRKGGIEGAQAAKAFHPAILWAALLSNLPFVIALLMLGTWRSAGVLAVVLFFVVAYSAPRLRFKERPLLDSVTSAAHFAGPLVFAASLVPGSARVWPFVVAFVLWGMASHAFGAIQDIVPDRAGQLSSIATVLGARRTLWFALTCYAASAFVLAVQGGLSIIVAVTELIYIANLVGFHAVTDASSADTNRGWRRFIWLNYASGFVVTMVLIASAL